MIESVGLCEGLGLSSCGFSEAEVADAVMEAAMVEDCSDSNTIVVAVVPDGRVRVSRPDPPVRPSRFGVCGWAVAHTGARTVELPRLVVLYTNHVSGGGDRKSVV